MSSRDVLLSKQASMTVGCGWDNPLQTYFCTVLRELPTIRADDDPVVLWLGLDPGEVRRPDDMVAPLAPYAELDAATIKLLRYDRARDLDCGPTPLQRLAIATLMQKRGRGSN